MSSFRYAGGLEPSFFEPSPDVLEPVSESMGMVFFSWSPRAILTLVGSPDLHLGPASNGKIVSSVQRSVGLVLGLAL